MGRAPFYSDEEKVVLKTLRLSGMTAKEIAPEMVRRGFPRRSEKSYVNKMSELGVKLSHIPSSEDSEKTISDLRDLQTQVNDLTIELAEARLHPPLPSDHPDLIQLESENRRLRDDIIGLNAKVRKAYRRNSLGEYIESSVRENTAPLEPVPIIKYRSESKGTPVDLIALLSDEHADEVLNPSAAWGLDAFDFDVFRCRLHRWAVEKVEYMTQHLPRHNFERSWIFKLGDGVNGDIHDMKDKNHFANTIKAAQAVGDAEAQALQFIARETGIPLHVVCLSGNHGRRTAKKNYNGPHDNFDYLIASQIATRLSEQAGIEVVAPESWTAFVDVRGHVCALNHGDDIRGTWGIPWYGVDRRANRIQALTARQNIQIKYFFYGHFHQPAQIPVGGAYARFNGAFPMTSGFAIDGLAVASDPAQSIFAVSDKGIILSADLWVRDLENENAFRAGGWEPAFGGETILDSLSPDAGEIGRLNVIRADQ